MNELAESILGKLVDKLDTNLANQKMFQTDDQGRLNSLTAVLTSEVSRINKLFSVIKVELLLIMFRIIPLDKVFYSTVKYWVLLLLKKKT